MRVRSRPPHAPSQKDNAVITEHTLGAKPLPSCSLLRAASVPYLQSNAALSLTHTSRGKNRASVPGRHIFWHFVSKIHST